MCDINTIIKNNITSKEPGIILWDNANCNGEQVQLSAGYYPDVTYNINTSYATGWEGIVGMWVPPNMVVTGYDRKNYDSASTTGDYPSGLYPNLDNPKTTNLGAKQIASLQVNRTKRWNEHLVNCCSGKAINGATPAVCGDYWGKGPGKGEECDELVSTFCTYRANDPRCSCYSQQDLPENTTTENLIRRVPICYSKSCSLRGYVPTSLTTENCPPVTVCEKQITTDVTNINIVPCGPDGKQIFTPSQPVIPVPVTPVPIEPTHVIDIPPVAIPDTTSATSSTSLYYIIMFLFICVVLSIYINYNIPYNHINRIQ
jgi:hypothetical protein